MLPPFSLDFELNDDISLLNTKEQSDQNMKLMLFDKILFLQNTYKVTFFDISFVVYLKEESDLSRYINYFNKKLVSIENFILRVYITTDIIAEKSKIIHNFVKSAINFLKKENSHLIIYLFNKSIYSLNLKSVVNAYSVTSILSNSTSSQLQNSHKKICLIPDKVLKYQIKFDIPFMSVIYSSYTRQCFFKKLRKKTILYGILSHLAVLPNKYIFEGEKEEVKSIENSNNESHIQLNNTATNNQNNSDKTHRRYVLKNVLNLNKEYVIPVNLNPSNCKQVHSDLVHCHFDYVFNLLRSSDKD